MALCSLFELVGYLIGPDILKQNIQWMSWQVIAPYSNKSEVYSLPSPRKRQRGCEG
jgi:hypothetical protein